MFLANIGMGILSIGMGIFSITQGQTSVASIWFLGAILWGTAAYFRHQVDKRSRQLSEKKNGQSASTTHSR